MTFTEDQIAELKADIKTHTIEPFSVSDIRVEQPRDEDGDPIVKIGDRFEVSQRNLRSLLSTIGVTSKITKECFKDPQQKWTALRDAIAKVDHIKNLGAIRDDRGMSCEIIETTAEEAIVMDYDARIDNLMETVDEMSDLKIHQLSLSPNCELTIQLNDPVNEIDVGTAGEKEDIWQTGFGINIGYNKQEYNAFYLRLVCSNGMTTKDVYARRLVSSKNIGKQLKKFIAASDFAGHVKDRVQVLRDCKASVHEAIQVVNQLPEDHLDAMAPWYKDLFNTYYDEGYDIEEMSSKQAKLAFTDISAYKVFNLATYSSTHGDRVDIPHNHRMSLNKIAGEMFAQPNLAVSHLNPYTN